MPSTRPIPDSYWLLDGQLLAGEYLGGLLPGLRADNVAELLEQTEGSRHR